jgi:alpha,alpha-trehalose-phosphate synthase [UDP-forming]
MFYIMAIKRNLKCTGIAVILEMSLSTGQNRSQTIMIKLKGKDRRLVVVSNRLPFTRQKNKKGASVWKKSTGGLITAMEPILLDVNGIWVGWDGLTENDIGNVYPSTIRLEETGLAEEKHIRDGKSYRIGCVPITDNEYEEYYNHLSNGTLWALFHYFFEKCFLDYTAWDTYCAVNRRFAEYVDKLASEDDIIWVQDYHLFMVPYYLRKIRPRQEIHFFLHIPFPNIDIFSILPWQDRIIESLLSCNTVGFHHKQYMHNFYGAVDSYMKRTKGKERERPDSSGKSYFYANPISVDFDLIDSVSRKPEVCARRDEIKRQSGCPKLILGIDRIDYSKGILERLQGLRLLFENHPELKEKLFYYQLVIPSREDVKAYRQLKRKIDELIGWINGNFSTGLWAPVHYNYGTVPLEELVALYSAADVALVTPLRDGMNLVCKEYVAAHSDNDGVLILSKFAGAIAEIKNCLPVNPYSIEDIANAIYQALHMPEAERKKRMTRMRANISVNNINTWLEKCLEYFETGGSSGGKMLKIKQEEEK